MSDTAPLSVVSLLEELHQVTDWYMLGVYLELPREELSQIEKQFLSHGLKRCKTELFDLWLKSNPKASWELIAIALEKSGEKVLAEDVRKRLSVSSSLPIEPSGAIKPRLDGSSFTVVLEKTLVKRFTMLERNFAVIVKDLKDSLENKQIPLKGLHRFLEARLGQGGEYMQATSIDKLFQQISPHYCFLNTTLLEDIIDEFIGEPLKHQLEKYEEQLDNFTSSTEITLLKEIQSQRPPNTDGMSQVVLKLRGCWLNVTIQRFQKLVRQIFGTAASDLTHIRVQDGCICISWLTRESAIPSLIALAQQKVEFMRHVGVLRLTVGDITISVREEDEEEEEESAAFNPALFHATNADCEEAIKYLLILGADPNCASEEGATPLMIACEKGSINITKVLLRERTNVNVQDKEGRTALMKVCGSPVASEDLVKLLIQSGADVHTQTTTGKTALMYATCRGHSNIVNHLLNEGADVNIQSSRGVTALMLACSYSTLDIAKFLLSYGADPNIQDSIGCTALMCACYKQQASAMELLLVHGADPNLQDFRGYTALTHACTIRSSSMDPSIPILLLSAGANPNAVSFEGFTALMSAATCGYLDGVQALLNAKADTNMQDRYGYTALHCAVEKGHQSVVELLLGAGVNASLANGDGQTALDLALAGNHHDVCQLLLMHMGSPNVPETEHVQHQTQQLGVQSQSTSSHPPHHHSIQQLREALHHPLSPAGSSTGKMTFKDREDDEEEEKMNIMKQDDVAY